jgi:hypothetical protein
MRRTLALVVLASSISLGTASAETIFINHDFDDRTPGVQGYFDRGLSLLTGPNGMSNLIEIVSTSDAVSPPNVVRAAISGALLEGRFMFADTPHFTPATDNLFFSITGIRESVNPYTIRLFDRGGSLLTEFTGNLTQGVGFHRFAPDIASFSFQPGDPSHALDDLRYSPPVIPEPATMLLVASGLVGAAARKRRSRASGRLH